MTDGDNIQWLVGGFNSSQWFGYTDRGNIPMGWTVSPSFAELAPSVLHAYFQEASHVDEFIAGPSGIGYSFADIMPEHLRKQFVLTTAEAMSKADLKIVNVLAESFSMDAASAYLESAEIDAVFYHLYSAYQGLNGRIAWSNNKPIIGARHQLWSGTFDSVDSLLQKLIQTSVRNPCVEEGYSLTPVHVWSNTVSDVLNLVHLLESKAPREFDVVLPNEFVSRISRNWSQ